MKFYTYLYTRRDGTSYYVGKGSGRRSRARHSVAVPPVARIIIQYWASENEALEMERWWIKLWGRKDIDTGILRNFSDGGELPTNLSPEAKARQTAKIRLQGKKNVENGHLSRLRTLDHQSRAGR